jgi:PAS domain S-box-containing protein
MVRFPGSSIRIRLFLLVVLAVIPMFALNLYTAAQERKAEINRVQNDALKLAQLISSVQEKQVEAARQFLISLTHMVEKTGPDNGACSVLFASLLRDLPMFANFTFVDERGKVRGSAVPLSAPSSVADQRWFQRTIETRDFVIADCTLTGAKQASSIILCIPLLGKGREVEGVVCASFDLDKWLDQVLTDLSMPPQTVVTVLDERGTVRACYPESERTTGRGLPDPSLARTVLSRNEGVTNGVDMEGIPCIFGFTPLHHAANHSYVNVSLREDTVLAGSWVKLLHNLTVLVLVTGLMMIVAMFSADLILLSRIRPLLSVTKHLAEGNLGARTGVAYGRSELSQLARTFDEMADALQRRKIESEQLMEVLQNVGSQFRAIFDNAFQFTAVLKPDGTLVEANRTALDFAGLSNAEVWGRPLWETPWWAVSPEVRQRLKETVAEAAKGNVVRYEVDNMGAGGKVVAVDFSIKPLRDEKGELTFLIAEARDISERKQAEAALKRSEMLYRAVVEDQTELILRYSPGFEITFVNGAYCRYFGEDREKILGRSFWRHVPLGDHEKVKEHIRSLSRSRPVASIERRVQTAEGNARWLKWTDRAIFDEQNEIIEYQSVGRDTTERKQVEESLRESEGELRLLSSQLLTAQEDERKRIARELHDSTGQSLSAVKFGVEKALSKMGRDIHPSGLQALAALDTTVQYAIDELRRITMDLRPSILDDLGVLVTMNWFCRDFQKIYSAIHIDKTIDLQEDEIPQPLKIVLFRVLQEAMNNIAKHSKASLVTISIKKGRSAIELAIDDNGKGFGLPASESGGRSKSGFGLSSMRERVEVSGGSFHINSVEGKGTSIRASWPCVFKKYSLNGDA